MQKVQCEQCNATLNVEDRKLGQVVTCPKCGKKTSLTPPVPMVDDALRDFVDPVDEEGLDNTSVESLQRKVNHRENVLRAKMQSYREQYAAIDRYASALRIFGVLLMAIAVFFLVGVFANKQPEEDNVVIAYSAYFCVASFLVGFWFLVFAQLLDGFVNICVSTERTADILEARN